MMPCVVSAEDGSRLTADSWDPPAQGTPAVLPLSLARLDVFQDPPLETEMPQRLDPWIRGVAYRASDDGPPEVEFASAQLPLDTALDTALEDTGDVPLEGEIERLGAGRTDRPGESDGSDSVRDPFAPRDRSTTGVVAGGPPG